MKKLTLEHLAGYLPYGLQIYWEELKDTVPIPWTLTAKHLDMVLMNQNKPILHPLSDLTKEIEVNGEKFVPMNMFYEMYGGGYSSKSQFKKDYYDNIIYTPYKSLSYETVQQLIEWHFDIYNLIKSDLAIDINTL